jgi:GNAT superfamily N-acetyltransferase
MNKINLQHVEIEKLKDFHELGNFQASNEDLRQFLIEDALHNQEHNISITFLWFYQKQLAAYITLLNDRITLDADLKQFFQQKHVHYNTMPALKIGRLCVDDRFQRRGLGRKMIIFAIETAKRVGKQFSGCRFLTVDSKSISTGFYKKQEFRILKKHRQGGSAMYLDLANT